MNQVVFPFQCWAGGGGDSIFSLKHQDTPGHSLFLTPRLTGCIVLLVFFSKMILFRNNRKYTYNELLIMIVWSVFLSSMLHVLIAATHRGAI